jgi:hypothetical protein
LSILIIKTWFVSNGSRGRIIAQKWRRAGRRGFKTLDFALQFFLLTIPYGPFPFRRNE